MRIIRAESDNLENIGSLLWLLSKRRRKRIVAALLPRIFAAERRHYIVGRERNKHRRRDLVEARINQMSPEFFKKMFRLDRASFDYLLDLIKEDIKPNEEYARRSSGLPVSPMLKLAAALRFISGGIYLDIAFSFDISYKHVHKYVWQVLRAIDRHLDNIKFPIDNEEQLRNLERGFLNICGGKFPGTVAAGDGVVFQIVKPNKEEVNGDVASFFTRKGYYAYGMQAFVDSSCKFLSISMNLCSSVHDSTAYIVSELSKRIKNGELPHWAHIVSTSTRSSTRRR